MGNTSSGFSSSFRPTSGSKTSDVVVPAHSKSATEHGNKQEVKTTSKQEDGSKNKSSRDSPGSKPTSSSNKQAEKKKPTKKEELKTKEVKGDASKAADKKTEKESNLVSQARKRAKQRNSLSWKDSLSQKDRKKLSSKDAILFSSTSKFHSEMLKVHNLYRADHGVPSLKMSKELNREAQERAAAYLKGETVKSQMPCSENGFLSYFTEGFKSVPSAVQVCSEWYEYAMNYDYNVQRKFPTKAVKFMNMVWAAEQEMGSGRATTGAGRTMVVALYRPRAEMPFNIQQNVRPPLAPLNSETFHREHEPHKTPDQPFHPTLSIKQRSA